MYRPFGLHGHHGICGRAVQVGSGSSTSVHADSLSVVRLFTVTGGKICAQLGEQSATFAPHVGRSVAERYGMWAKASGRSLKYIDQGDGVAGIFRYATGVEGICLPCSYGG